MHDNAKSTVTNEAGELNSLKGIAQVFGLFAGIGTVVYVAGGGVLALRLGFEDLPVEAVIAQLPKAFLVTVGITTIVLPAVLGATLYGGWRLYCISTKPSGARGLVHEAAGLLLRGIRRAATMPSVMAVLLVTPGILIELCKDGWRGTLLLWAAVAFLVTLLWAYAMYGVRNLVIARYNGTWGKAGPIALMSAVYGALLLPGSIVVGATVPLVDVKACTVGGSARLGSLVGETSDRLYFGEKREHQDKKSRRIISLPQSNITETFVGDDAERVACNPKLQKATAP